MVHNNPDVDLVSDNLVEFCLCNLKILSKTQIRTSMKGRNSVANLQKMRLYNPKIGIVMIMCIQNLVNFCQFILKIWSKKQIPASVKGRNSVANLRIATIYKTNVDLVNGNVYTKFGLILPIHSQDNE